MAMFKRIALTALVLCAFPVPVFAQTTDWSQAKRIEVDLSNYAFAPKELHLQHGTPYVLHLVNTAGKSHNFSASEFFASSTIAPEDQSRVAKGAVELDEQQSADVRLVPNTPGSYDVHCSHFLHESFGMSGKVIVD
jgi:plastocyanin